MTTRQPIPPVNSPEASPLILGGSGYIGSHLVRHLRAHGFSPVVAGRGAGCDVPFHLSSPERLPPALLEERVVIHLASAVVPAALSAEGLAAAQAELDAFSRLLLHLEACRCGRLIFLSSGGCVYGPSQETLISENHPTRPINAYGYLKLGCETLMGLFRHQRAMDVVSLRPSNCYGPHQRVRYGQGVIASFISDIRSGQPITLFGDGSVERDYLSVHDLVRAITALISASALDDWIFNVSSGATHSLRWIIDQLQSFHGAPIAIDLQPARAFDAPRIGLDPSALMAAIPWQPQIALAAGLREQWDAFGR